MEGGNGDELDTKHLPPGRNNVGSEISLPEKKKEKKVNIESIENPLPKKVVRKKKKKKKRGGENKQQEAKKIHTKKKKKKAREDFEFSELSVRKLCKGVGITRTASLFYEPFQGEVDAFLGIILHAASAYARQNKKQGVKISEEHIARALKFYNIRIFS